MTGMTKVECVSLCQKGLCQALRVLWTTTTLEMFGADNMLCIILIMPSLILPAINWPAENEIHMKDRAATSSPYFMLIRAMIKGSFAT
jgi:hypothetical protein